MTSFFQRLFGKADVAAPVRGPLGLHLNAGFTLNTLAFRLLEEALLIELPGEEYTVAAISHIDLGGGSQIFATTRPEKSFCKSIPRAAQTLMISTISNFLFMQKATGFRRKKLAVCY